MCCVEVTSEFCEFYGAMLGDGCIGIYQYGNRLPRHTVLLTGSMYDRDYYVFKIIPILNKLYGDCFWLRKKSNANALLLRSYQKTPYICLRKFGFPTGKKHNLIIPPCFFQNTQYVKACIRGIFDTDGSVYLRYSKKYKNHAKHYMYMNVQFKMTSPFLLRQIEVFLTTLGIVCNNRYRDGTSTVLRITDQKSVHRFFALIEPSNFHHQKRYLYWAQRDLNPRPIG